MFNYSFNYFNYWHVLLWRIITLCLIFVNFWKVLFFMMIRGQIVLNILSSYCFLRHPGKYTIILQQKNPVMWNIFTAQNVQLLNWFLLHNYHPRMRVGNVFSHVCVSVCLSVCSVCLSVCVSVCVSVCWGYNFWTAWHRNFIFGMQVHLDYI